MNTRTKMFAVFKTGGKQYRVAAEDVLQVEKVKGDRGEIVEFGEVLLVGGETVTLGAPTVSGATVAAEVLDQSRGPKDIARSSRSSASPRFSPKGASRTKRLRRVHGARRRRPLRNPQIRKLRPKPRPPLPKSGAKRAPRPRPRQRPEVRAPRRRNLRRKRPKPKVRGRRQRNEQKR